MNGLGNKKFVSMCCDFHICIVIHSTLNSKVNNEVFINIFYSYG